MVQVVGKTGIQREVLYMEGEVVPDAVLYRLPLHTMRDVTAAVYPDEEDLSSSKAAQHILSIKGVAGVTFGALAFDGAANKQDYVTINRHRFIDKKPVNWAELDPLVVTKLDEMVGIMKANPRLALVRHDGLNARKERDDLIRHFKEAGESETHAMAHAAVVDVSRRWARHGGGVVLKDVKDGIVTVFLRGACGTCPSSSKSVEEGLEALLSDFLGNEFKELRALKP